MRFSLVVASLFICILFSCSCKGINSTDSSESKIIGVYDRDILLHEMPGYQRIIDSIAEFKKHYDAQEVLMFCELYKKRDEFYRDSAKLSLVIKEIRLREIENLRQNIGEFAIYSSEELSMRTQWALAPLNNQITTAASKIVIKKKTPYAVHDRAEFEALLQYNKPPGKVVTVNDQMRVLLGIE